MQRPASIRTAFAVTVALALVACASAYRHAASDDIVAEGVVAADSAVAARPLRLFLTGRTRGYLTKCGCQSAQYGGLARRAAYLHAVGVAGDLRIDLGNLLMADAREPGIMLDYALDGLATLHYDALVPGEGEVKLGAAFEDALRRRPGLRVICANLTRTQDDSRVFDPWFLAPVAGGRTAAVVGVVEPFGRMPAGYRVAPLDETIAAAIADLRGKADMLVVAGSLRESTALELAARFPDVALVVGGRADVGSKGVVQTSGAPAMFVGEYGWYVSRVDFDDALHVAQAWQAWLDDGLPDDPDVAVLVARYGAMMSADGTEYTQRLESSLRTAGYLGSEGCAECHQAEYAAWTSSKHSHAMQTLADKQAARDQQCVPCHLMDVSRGGAPRAVETFGVGCEGCHGGAARHADLAHRVSSAAAVRALAPATAAVCVRCHTPPNDTHFAFDDQWPKIAHGKTAPR